MHDGENDVFPLSARRKPLERKEFLVHLLWKSGSTQKTPSCQQIMRRTRHWKREQTHLAVHAHLSRSLSHPTNLQMDQPLKSPTAPHPLPTLLPHPSQSPCQSTRQDTQQQRVVRGTLRRPLIDAKDRVPRETELERPSRVRLKSCNGQTTKHPRRGKNRKSGGQASE